ncbi:helix-turn-helix domain-containing protein [Croceitalea sp. MTPC5]|uniref:helix-turn-helix domain-containing protein n=1 Tax=Croceitalea sp. MTPC5 TaxID=3056565 RepID=UPI0030CE386B
MQEIRIENQNAEDLLSQLNVYLKGTLTEKWGEQTLTFSNHLGEGTIRSISFDWGVSLFDYDVNFKEDVKLIHHTGDEIPVEFIFISNGTLRYQQDVNSEEVFLERYRNIIIAPKQQSKKTFIFPKKVNVKVNFIQIVKGQYAKKKHNNLKYLNEVLFSVFKEDEYDVPYRHFGNYNLAIADKVKEMHASEENGMVRTLGIEGKLNIILAMQILEHHKFQNDTTLPDSLTIADIKKIHKLADFIVDNISEALTIPILSKESGLSGKKLQVGFKMLYNKTVNEYIKKLRLEISRDLLKNSELTVSEIVYKVGIRSRSYFSKIFSEHYGILPTEYRSKLKRKPSL